MPQRRQTNSLLGQPEKGVEVISEEREERTMCDRPVEHYTTTTTELRLSCLSVSVSSSVVSEK